MYPAGVSGIRVRELRLPSGVAVRVLEAGPATGDPVVLVHGWGASVYTFRHAFDALQRAGRRALGFDLRGHGLSDKPVERGAYSSGALLDDVRGFMDVCEIARADIVGHSLGGALALRFAIAHPERVRRLVLAAPVGLTDIRLRRIARRFTPRSTERFARYLPPRWFTAFLVKGAYCNPRRVRQNVVDEYWAPSQFPEYYHAVRALLHEFGWDPVLPNELERLVNKSLVILGNTDRLIGDAEEAARGMPHSTVVTIEGAGHLVAEECASEFNAAMTGFLDDA